MEKHNLCKRVISVFLVLLMTVLTLPVTNITSNAADVTIASLKSKYPAGKYWNGGNANSCTSSPCTHHNGNCQYDGSCGCNSYKGLAIQCMGFAYQLAYLIYGGNPYSDFTTKRDVSALDSLKPGDVVRYKNNGHSIFVYAVKGDTVTYADCNSDGHCIIRWDQTISKSTIKASFSYVDSAPRAYNGVTNPTKDTKFTVPKYSFTKATGKTLVYDSCDGTAKTNKIYDTDLCTIKEIYTNGWCKVTFPLDAGGTETGYCKTSVFFNTGYDYFNIKAKNKLSVYTRSDLKTALKDPSKNTVTIAAGTSFQVLGHTSTAIQIEVKFSSKQMIGWVPISALTSTVKYNANGGTGTMSNGKAIYQQKLTLAANKFTREGYTFQNWSVYRTGDKKWYTAKNGWQTAANISSNNYAKYTYKDGYSNSALAKVWFEGGVAPDELTFHANWKANTLSVYYNANGASISSDTYKLSNNLIYNKSDSTKYAQTWIYNVKKTNGLVNKGTFGLTKTGYTFKGWGTTSSGGTIFDPDDANVLPTDLSSAIKKGNASVTLYAIWVPNTLSVYYNANGGTVSSDTFKVVNNDIYNVSDSSKFVQQWPYNSAKQYGLGDAASFGLTRTGYTFAGWNTKIDGSGTTYSDKDSSLVPTTLNPGIKDGNVSLTLYAKWTPNTYSVKYDANGGTGAPSAQTKTYGTDLNLSSVTPTRSGYIFKGWASSSSATAAEYQAGGSYKTNADVTLYAVWEQAAHVHSWNTDYTVDTPATCTQAGVKSIHCKTCSETKSVTSIPALGHSYSSTWTTDTAATCTENGKKSQTCTRCKAKGNITVIPATGHSFGNWTVKQDAGCETAGEKQRECSACHAIETQTIKATGHSYGNWIVDTEPGCESVGAKHRICASCNDIETETIPANGHSFSSHWTVDKEASCTESGIKSHHCLNCDETADETVIAALGHSFGSWIVEDEATCTKDGEKYRVCYSCDETEIQIIPATGQHNYDKGKNTKQPRCTTAGVRTYTCLDCGDTYNETLPALGHSYSAAVYEWSEDNSTVKATRTCTRDSSHIETETVTTTSNITKQATYTSDGEMTYTAVFKNSAFSKQTKKVVIPRLVDDYKDFPDVVKGDWYYDAVKYCAVREYVSGYNNGNFGPNDNLKRQDFVCILARIAGADLSKYENKTSKLKDVQKGAYYAPAVNWAVENGIISGYNNGKFGVGDNITREQIAVIFYRYVGSPKVTGVDSTLAKFTDAKKVSPFAKTPVAWAVQQRIINGMDDGRVAATESASRAQIAAIIERMDRQGMF